jgi:adenylosuccinate lyase
LLPVLALTQAGLDREAAYSAVQDNAMEVWRGRGNFLDLLVADPRIAPVLDRATLAGFFDVGYHLAHVDTIFRRVFGRA